MTGIIGTRELAIRLPQGGEERIPLALFEAAISSLTSERLAERIRLWTLGRPTSDATALEPVVAEVEIALEAVAELENDLLAYAEDDATEQGLLTITSDEAPGLLVSGEDLPSSWATVPAHAVLALALGRIRLLARFDTRVLLVDVSTAGNSF